MAMFELTPEKQEEWTRRWRESVQPYLDGEELEAVGPFQRQGQWFLTIPLIGQLGALVYFSYQGLMKKRAGGLPNNFLVAVTRDRVRAFKYRQSYSKIKVQKEVADFARGDIRVAEHSSGGLADAITFEVTEDGETERIKVNVNMMSRNPWAGEVVEALKR